MNTRRLLTIAALSIAAAAQLAASASESPQISVREQDDSYSVRAVFSVAQPASTVFAVLTDYDRIPEFMPDVRTSRVIERTDRHAVIEQEAVARFMMFSKRIHLVLDVDEELGGIRFHDRCGRSFSIYEGVWTITEQAGRTAVAYQLTAKPTFEVPEFLLKRLLKRDAKEMIERLAKEIEGRAGDGVPAAETRKREGL
jgi:ribosome-associated toxin RatA of RatAB toxin-antitoxin module